MGYTTDFYGRFDIEPPLKREHIRYLQAFAGSRRMKRNAARAAALPDPVREAVGLPIGEDGEYFVGTADVNKGQNNDESVIEGDGPPANQPGLWCQWEPTDDGRFLQWNGIEKFYHYTDWLRYLVTHFFDRWGYRLDGDVQWQGEDPGDTGILKVVNGVVLEGLGVVVYKWT